MGLFYDHLILPSVLDRPSVPAPGSFDKTAKIWDCNTGQVLHTLKGHQTEIVCVAFSLQGTLVATGSMDNTAKLWDVDSGQLVGTGRTAVASDQNCEHDPG
ncbi:unnamed protein product [Prorocentrum cordatum]|uniref:Uncharacterized protein n=1 Tax=Prorocentrum cordatum TaxID=2364126 RepID=A0ABN9X467_9DINO|nr:unnamed protein product [Polarella glacialis]